MKIQQIKIKDGLATIKYESHDENGFNTLTQRAYNLPVHPDFQEAYDSFNKHAFRIGQPTDMFRRQDDLNDYVRFISQIEIKCISLKRDSNEEEDDISIQISFTFPGPGGAKQNTTTGYILLGESMLYHFANDMEAHWERLQTEALLYIKEEKYNRELVDQLAMDLDLQQDEGADADHQEETTASE